MISDLFYAFGKQQYLQSCVNGQISKNGLQVRTRRLSMFGRVGLKKDIFISRNGSAILFQRLWFHARKLHYWWLSFCVMDARRQDK